MSELSGLDTSELLSRLRDIQEPMEPQGTSLWIIVATLALAVTLVCLYQFQRQRKRYAFRQEALTRLEVIANRESGSTSGPLFELASLLRQLMRHRQGEAINTLDGSRWLSALDHEFDTQWFSQGRGQVFGNSLYQSSCISQSDLKQLCKELKDEIKRLKSPMSIKQSFA